MRNKETKTGGAGKNVGRERESNKLKKELGEAIAEYGKKREGIKRELSEAIAHYDDMTVYLRNSLVSVVEGAVCAVADAAGGRLSFKVPEGCPDYMDAMRLTAKATRISANGREAIALVEYVESCDGQAVVGLRNPCGQAFRRAPRELLEPEAVLEFIRETL